MVTALATAATALAGVLPTPKWALAAGAILITLAVTALVYSLDCPPGHRVHGRWLATALFAVVVAGGVVLWAERPSDDVEPLFELVVDAAPAEYYRLRAEPGGQAQLEGTQLWGGTRYWFECSRTYEGTEWLRDISGQWMPGELLRWPNASEPKSIPEC